MSFSYNLNLHPPLFGGNDEILLKNLFIYQWLSLCVFLVIKYIVQKEHSKNPVESCKEAKRQEKKKNYYYGFI